VIVDILDRHDPRQFGLSGLFTWIAETLSGAREPAGEVMPDRALVHRSRR